MKKIIKNDIVYKIIPEKKMVIGESEFDYTNYLGDFLSANSNQRSIMLNAIALNTQDWLTDIRTIRATAICDSRDEFNEKTGMAIVAEKIANKKHLMIARQMDRIHRMLIETAVKVGESCVKHVEKSQAIQDDLKKMYYGKE